MVVDLSADFRIGTRAYQRYGEHPNVNALDGAVYGLAELSRNQLPGARLISGVGCNATAMNPALAVASGSHQALWRISRSAPPKRGRGGAGSHHPVRARTAWTYSLRAPPPPRSSRRSARSTSTRPSPRSTWSAACSAPPTSSRQGPSNRRNSGSSTAAFGDEPFVRIVGPGPKIPRPRVCSSGRTTPTSAAVDRQLRGASWRSRRSTTSSRGCRLGDPCDERRGSGSKKLWASHSPVCTRVISTHARRERVTMSTIVIKIGGEGIEPTALCPEIASLVREATGLSSTADRTRPTCSPRLGHSTQTITSPGGQQSRRTDRHARDLRDGVLRQGEQGRGRKPAPEDVDAVGLRQDRRGALDRLAEGGHPRGRGTAERSSSATTSRAGLSCVDAAFLNLLMDAGRVVV